MIIYLAGGITGNLQPLWKKVAGGGQIAHIPDIHDQQILESYYYCRDNKWMPQLIPHFKEFLLDSGAFTFRMNAKKNISVDWEKYTRDYAEFIKKNNVKLFFEMDIDSLVGLDYVEGLRRELQQETKRDPIPVWHYGRGWEYFQKMVRQYKYVAIATTPFGIEGRTFRKHEHLIPKFIREAHQNGAKIHGLGYTSVAKLKDNHFDSVDSTAWLYGNRGGYLYVFDPTDPAIFKKVMVPKGKRLNPQASALHNFIEWNKFQRYAEKYF